jgi:hypothetical protein
MASAGERASQRGGVSFLGAIGTAGRELYAVSEGRTISVEIHLEERVRFAVRSA